MDMDTGALEPNEIASILGVAAKKAAAMCIQEMAKQLGYETHVEYTTGGTTVEGEHIKTFLKLTVHARKKKPVDPSKEVLDTAPAVVSAPELVKHVRVEPEVHTFPDVPGAPGGAAAHLVQPDTGVGAVDMLL